jgi:hypothetical protein
MAGQFTVGIKERTRLKQFLCAVLVYFLFLTEAYKHSTSWRTFILNALLLHVLPCSDDFVLWDLCPCHFFLRVGSIQGVTEKHVRLVHDDFVLKLQDLYFVAVCILHSFAKSGLSHGLFQFACVVELPMKSDTSKWHFEVGGKSLAIVCC